MHTSGSPPREVVQVLVEAGPGGKWTPHSLELLSEARALAARLNGGAGGWALLAPSGGEPDCGELATQGCRRILFLVSDRFAPWSSEAAAAALAAHLSPGNRLVLLPGTARGEEAAALLAEKLRAAWIPDALTLGATRTGALEITAVLPGGKLSRTFRPAGEGPVVVTMRPGVAEIVAGKADPIQIDRIPVDLSQVPILTTVEQTFAADPRTVDLTFADRIVSAGRGAGGPEGVAQVAELAAALQASLGGSRLAVDLGWLPPARQVGQTGRTVSPDLYVACGISGASHHLLGMRSSKHIIAINSDPQAPIHEIAHLGLQADLHQIIPLIVAALEKRTPPARRPS